MFYGKARLKAEVAKHVDLDIENLPFNTALIKQLVLLKESGEKLILTTAANHRIANAVAMHLNIFDEVISSDDTNNLSNKAETLVKRYGKQGFDYAGNSRADLKVWRNARHAFVVGPSLNLSLYEIEQVCTIDGRIPSPFGRLWEFIRCLRPHQWSKNLLLFLPIIAAHQLNDSGKLVLTISGFLTYCILVSALYMFNDLLDLSSDRLHPEKKDRPFASGSVPILFGLIMVPLMVGGALTLGWLISNKFLMALSLYALVSLSYSLFLKNIVILDVIILALLYVLRVISGGIVADINLSFWLLSFSMFFFFGLAFTKRFAELLSLSERNQEFISGRGYRKEDLEITRVLGVASGFLSILVLALYINDESVVYHYNQPKFLWAFCPLLIYWVSHMWVIASRAEMHHDPIVFTMRDKTSWWIALLGMVIFWMAI